MARHQDLAALQRLALRGSRTTRARGPHHARRSSRCLAAYAAIRRLAVPGGRLAAAALRPIDGTRPPRRRASAPADRAARRRAPSRPCAARQRALEVGADAEAFDGAQHLVDRQEEDVARLRRCRPGRANCAAHGEEDAPGTAEQRACARSAGSRGRAPRALGPAQSTARARQALERLAAQQDRRRGSRLAALQPARGAGLRAAAATAMSSGAGSSASVMLSSFSSSVQRSPNFAM